MTFNDILHKFRSESFTQKDKGTQFERLMRSWLLSDPRYSNLTKVWLWDDFPSRADLGGKDTGIDLVARTEEGDYWAIQCKCYKEDSVIDKPAVDSFLATSSRQFKDPETLQTTSFAKRMWISTTNHWGKNAEDAIQNQNPPFNRVGLVDLQNSPVDWQLLIDGLKGKEAMLPGKQPREHQLRAMSAAHAYFQEHDRGKLIMACGTGKTYTALKIAEDLLNNKGLVLFMVPSISLLGQSLNAWCADAVNPIKGICICSDSRASRKIKKDFDDTQDSVVDLAVPATTNPKSIAKQLKLYRNHNGLTVVFSTYQSIEAIHAAQHEILKETAGTYGKFDLIVCDEAHRTTGVKLSDRDESNFTKIHDAEYIKDSYKPKKKNDSGNTESYDKILSLTMSFYELEPTDSISIIKHLTALFYLSLSDNAIKANIGDKWKDKLIALLSSSELRKLFKYNILKDKQEGASRVFIAIDEKLYAFYNIRLGNKLVKQLFPNKIFLNKDDYHDPLKNIEELLFSL